MAAAGQQELMEEGSVEKESSEPSDQVQMDTFEMRRFFSSFHGDTRDLAKWSNLRLNVARMLRSTPFEIGLGVLISISFLLVILEAEYVRDPPQWLEIPNKIFLAIYVVECSLRIYVLRCDYFCSAMNMLDLSIVVSDIIGELISILGLSAAPSLVALRIFRLLRLTRSLKIMMKFPQLALLVKGLVNAIGAVCYGLCMLVVLLLFWSVCAVHFIHPVNDRIRQRGDYDGCDRCGRAFDSVSQAMLTFVQQIVAGDSWGQVTIPIIEESPITALFFTMVFVSISLSLLNVILAVIVDSALKTSQEDELEIVKQKHEEFNQSAVKLKRLCRRMDTDGSGDLTAEELLGGYDNHEEFRNHLTAMDIKREDMNVVFAILDSDGSGTVQYDEFINELFKMKSQDSHTLLVFIRHYVTEIRKDVREQICMLKKDVYNKIEADMEMRRHSMHESVGQGSCQLEPIDAKGPSVCSSPAVTEEKERKDNPSATVAMPPVKGEISTHLWEELRNLRSVISEELVCSMKEISQKAENHTSLLASIAGDTSVLRSSDGGATVPTQLAGLEARKPASSGRGLPRSSRSSASASGAAGAGLGSPCSDRGTATLTLEQTKGTATLSLRHDASAVPSSPPSAWSKCCAAQQRPVVVHVPYYQPAKEADT